MARSAAPPKMSMFSSVIKNVKSKNRKAAFNDSESEEEFAHYEESRNVAINKQEFEEVE